MPNLPRMTFTDAVRQARKAVADLLRAYADAIDPPADEVVVFYVDGRPVAAVPTDEIRHG